MARTGSATTYPSAPDLPTTKNSNLLDHLEKCQNKLMVETTPTRFEITDLITELTLMIENALKDRSPSDWTFMQALSEEVLINWYAIVKLIRRRVFNDDFSGAALIAVAEIDYLHADAMASMYIGSLLPVIDFEITMPLGYFYAFPVKSYFFIEIC